MSEYSDWVPAMLTSVFGGFITKIESLCIVLTTRPARSDFTLNSISDRFIIVRLARQAVDSLTVAEKMN